MLGARPAPADPRAPISASAALRQGRFVADEFGTVGVFGLDWLLDPRFTRLLDYLAASPGAVRGVRVFGSLSLGRDRTFPTTAADVWEDAAEPMTFGRTLEAIDALISRGLMPFLPLTFFPRAVSPAPTEPPAEWERWQVLVAGFLDACVGRFGAAEVASWRFEVWNEPNMPPFWRGTFDQYLALYRATAAAVRAADHRVQLGGPVIAYIPGGEGEALMERFLHALAADPALQCDFISLHRKGAWTNEEREPELGRLLEAAETTAAAVLRIVPARARSLAIVNDEADMLVGFDRPYPPRMTSQFPAWLAAAAIAHDALSARHAEHGMRFHAASDDANQQLPQAPFDGRRSLMTPVSAPDDLVKLPVYAFYELLRLMGPERGGAASGPVPDGVSHLLTCGQHGIAALLTRWADQGEAVLDYQVRDVPWARINTVTFCIDAAHTNPQAAFPDAAAMRQAQELGTSQALRSGIALPDRTVRQRLALGPFSTVLLWITPYDPGRPVAPRLIEGKRERANAVLRWTPDRSPGFFSYEVRRKGVAISPLPLRSAIWIDTAPPSGPLRYEISTLSASGQRSPAADIRL